MPTEPEALALDALRVGGAAEEGASGHFGRSGVGMSFELWINAAVGIAILAFLWNLHRDMADVREHLARLDGTVATLREMLSGILTRRDS